MHKVEEEVIWYCIPGFLDLSLQFWQWDLPSSAWIMVLDIIFHPCPDMLNWVKVRGECRPVYYCNTTTT